MKAEYSVHEISELLSVSRRAVLKLAADRGWAFREEHNTSGGKARRFFITASMTPEDLERLSKAVTIQPAGQLPIPFEAAPSPALVESPHRERKALARADLLKAYTDTVDSAPWGERTLAREQFMAAYNAGITYPLVFGILGEISWQAVERWKSKLEAVPEPGKESDLADRRGSWKRGKHGLTHEQEEVVLRCVCHPNAPKISEAIRLAKAIMESRGIANGHSERTYRRFVEDWKSRNFHRWTMDREGKKAWNDKCACYIERDYDMLEVGDIVVADGHILNFEIVNPFTGKPSRMVLITWYDMKSNMPLGWEIMPTENVAAISSALRRAILRLGKIPRVAYLDNGRAFAARFFNGIDLEQTGVYGAFGRLGIETIFAWPYHAQSKTVERWHGTLAEFERLCPTYVGTSIANKPPRMNRGETLHRRVYDKMTGGECLTLEQAHRAFAAWLDMYAARPQKGHLQGRTPMELFLEGRGPGVDKQELIFLMMDAKSRTINQNGVGIFGQNYYNPALYGRRHDVTVRYDLQDRSSIYIFDARDDSFICEAAPVEKVHPAAWILGTRDDQDKVKAAIIRYKRQEKEASASFREFANSEVIPEYRGMLKGMGIENGQKALAEPEPKQLPMSQAEEKRIQAEYRELQELQAELPTEPACEDDGCAAEVVDDAAEMRLRLSRMSEADRYETLADMAAQQLFIPKDMQAFMVYYENTPAYEKQREYYEERALNLAAAMRR